MRADVFDGDASRLLHLRANQTNAASATMMIAYESRWRGRKLVKSGEKRRLSAADFVLLLRIRFALQEYEVKIAQWQSQIADAHLTLSGAPALASSGRVSVQFWLVLANCDCTHHFTDTFTDSGRSDWPNSLLLTQQNMEARVGIGRLMPVFRLKTTWFAEQFQYTLSLFGLTGFNSLTEDFTEGF